MYQAALVAEREDLVLALAGKQEKRPNCITGGRDVNEQV